MAKIIRNGIEYGIPSYSKSEIDRKLALKVSKSEVESELNESTNPVSSKAVKKALEEQSSGIFEGTLDEWDALSPAEQAQYDFIATPDDNGSELPLDVYSTSETKTNKVWIDGKPIYRVVLEHAGTSLASGDWKTLFTNLDWLSNVDMITEARIFGYYDSNKTSLRHSHFIDVRTSGTTLQYYATTNTGLSGGFYVVLEYTKITD